MFRKKYTYKCVWKSKQKIEPFGTMINKQKSKNASINYERVYDFLMCHLGFLDFYNKTFTKKKEDRFINALRN